MQPDISADPFREMRTAVFRERVQLLGGQFCFETDSSRLLRIVRLAYAKLPAHRLGAGAPGLLVRLALTCAGRAQPSIQVESEPPLVSPMAGGGILCAALQTANFVAVTPQQRSALVVVSRDMLRFPYHIRYEMLEFAVYVLASRVQGLVPLHAACVGRGGCGILLLGPSGSGKSTVSLHCALHGLDFIAEDSVLVRTGGLLATGVANFLHVRPDSLRFVTDADSADVIRNSPVIHRRSGVEKFEVDLRRSRYRLAPAPLRIGAVVFVSPRRAGSSRLLSPLRDTELQAQLVASQPYAANQPEWKTFAKQVSCLPAFELRRGLHPVQAVEALERLLPTGPAAVARKRKKL